MLWLAVLISSATLLFSQGAITDGSDGLSMYEVAKALVEHRTLAIEPRLGFRGRDGRYYASHGFGLPLIAVLPYLAARPLAKITPFPEVVSEGLVASTMPIVVGLLAVALYRLARRLQGSMRTSLTLAIGAVVGTYLLPYSKEFFSEPVATLFLILAIELAIACQPLGAGVATAATAITRPQFFAFVPLLIWRLFRERGWSALFWAAPPIALGLLVALGYNVARFGDPLKFDPLGFSAPLLRGAGGLLLHPEKSLLLFAPIVVLVPFGLRYLWQNARTAFWLLGGHLVASFLIVAKWAAWGGGWVWGPRLLIPAVIPAIASLAPWVDSNPRRRYPLVVLLFFIGFLVSGPTLLVSQRAQLIEAPPEFGPSIIRQYSLIPDTLDYTRRYVLAPNARHQHYAKFLNIWQVGLIRLLGPQGLYVAVPMSLILVLAVALSSYRLKMILLSVTPRRRPSSP